LRTLFINYKVYYIKNMNEVTPAPPEARPSGGLKLDEQVKTKLGKVLEGLGERDVSTKHTEKAVRLGPTVSREGIQTFVVDRGLKVIGVEVPDVEVDGTGLSTWTGKVETAIAGMRDPEEKRDAQELLVSVKNLDKLMDGDISSMAAWLEAAEEFYVEMGKDGADMEAIVKKYGGFDGLLHQIMAVRWNLGKERSEKIAFGPPGVDRLARRGIERRARARRKEEMGNLEDGMKGLKAEVDAEFAALFGEEGDTAKLAELEKRAAERLKAMASKVDGRLLTDETLQEWQTEYADTLKDPARRLAFWATSRLHKSAEEALGCKIEGVGDDVELSFSEDHAEGLFAAAMKAEMGIDMMEKRVRDEGLRQKLESGEDGVPEELEAVVHTMKDYYEMGSVLEQLADARLGTRQREESFGEMAGGLFLRKIGREVKRSVLSVNGTLEFSGAMEGLFISGETLLAYLAGRELAGLGADALSGALEEAGGEWQAWAEKAPDQLNRMLKLAGGQAKVFATAAEAGASEMPTARGALTEQAKFWGISEVLNGVAKYGADIGGAIKEASTHLEFVGPMVGVMAGAASALRLKSVPQFFKRRLSRS
jgi:hypothetical protein